MKINKEWVAAGMSDTVATSMKNASNRYKNEYTAPTYTEKVGDAIATIGGWHGSTATTWLRSTNNSAVTIVRGCLLRSYAGSIFSYFGHGYGYTNEYDNNDIEKNRRDADYRKPWSSRAVVVVGSGV